jgi:hypothetical protein
VQKGRRSGLVQSVLHAAHWKRQIGWLRRTLQTAPKSKLPDFPEGHPSAIQAELERPVPSIGCIPFDGTPPMVASRLGSGNDEPSATYCIPSPAPHRPSSPCSGHLTNPGNPRTSLRLPIVSPGLGALGVAVGQRRPSTEIIFPIEGFHAPPSGTADIRIQSAHVCRPLGDLRFASRASRIQPNLSCTVAGSLATVFLRGDLRSSPRLPKCMNGTARVPSVWPAVSDFQVWFGRFLSPGMNPAL